MNGSREHVGSLAGITGVVREADETAELEVGLALPATLITLAKVPRLSIGAQDVHFADGGAFTGDLSASMLADAGAQWAIVGHSERRSGHDEENRDTLAKLNALARANLGAILCVGEPGKQRDANQAEAFVARQLHHSLPRDFASDRLAVAYEPVWAIGSDRAASLTDIAQMCAAIRGALNEHLGRDGESARILYGGSVDHRNVGEIMTKTGVDGILAGRASLDATNFGKMIHAAIKACRCV